MQFSENCSCQRPVTRGKWIWAASPSSPGQDGLLKLTTHCQAPELAGSSRDNPTSLSTRSISRGSTLLAMAGDFPEWLYQFTHPPTAGMRPRSLGAPPCLVSIAFLIFPARWVCNGMPLWFRFTFASLLMSLSFSHIHSLVACPVSFNACSCLLPFFHQVVCLILSDL